MNKQKGNTKIFDTFTVLVIMLVIGYACYYWFTTPKIVKTEHARYTTPIKVVNYNPNPSFKLDYVNLTTGEKVNYYVKYCAFDDGDKTIKVGGVYQITLEKEILTLDNGEVRKREKITGCDIIKQI